MDFKLFDKSHEQIGQASAYVDNLREEALKLERRLRSYEGDSAKLAANAEQIDSLKRKYSTLVDERDQLVMERELMRKKVERIVLEVDEALIEKALEE